MTLTTNGLDVGNYVVIAFGVLVSFNGLSLGRE